MFIFIAIVQALIALGVIYFLINKQTASARGAIKSISKEAADKSALLAKMLGLFSQMIDIKTIRERAAELVSLQDSMKAERGRITITQAELETVEGRLRELEEIERELEASGLETKEELNILQKKAKEMQAKNAALKQQIADAYGQMDQALTDIKLSAELQTQVDQAKLELVQTQEKIDLLLIQVEGSNEQYTVLKRRYDALDIEYAQLFEKFSEAEAAIQGGGGGGR